MNKLIALCLLLLFADVSVAQSPATGFPPFGSFQGGGFDSVDLYNLNVGYVVPVVSHPGRGAGFNFALAYSSSVWTKNSSGSAWSPIQGWGWYSSGPVGTIQYQKVTIICISTPYTGYINYTYTDPMGTSHPFPVQYWPPGGCNIQAARTGNASDASGYFIDVSNPTGPIVRFPDGTKMTATVFASGYNSNPVLTDPNGNKIQWSSNAPSGETDWLDTLGQVVLKVTGGCGLAATSYQRLAVDGSYQTITVKCSQFNVKTNFACSGITEYSATGVWLTSEIDLPNGQKYSFDYEPTPSYPGYVTGRIQQITLPDGGTITYQYTGANDGINCTDAAVSGFTRTISDGTTSSAWTYSRVVTGTGSSATTTTTVTAPQLSYDTAPNQTVYGFDSNGHETSRKIYHGSATGTPLRTVNTVWASNKTPSARTTIFEDGTTQTQSDTTFDSNGLLQLLKEHDLGSGAPGPIIRTTTLTYLTSTAYTSLNIINKIVTRTIADSAGTKYRIDIAYDQAGYVNSKCVTGALEHDDTNYGCSYTTRGLPTLVTTYTNPASPSGGITKNFSYDSVGNLVSAQLNCCQQKQWTFSSSTQFAYPDSVVSGASTGPQLTTNVTYNVSTGQVATFTDENGQKTTYTYADPGHMDRLTDVARPDGAHITYAYNDVGRTATVTSPVQGTSAVNQISYFDPLGRPNKSQVTDGGGTSYSIKETQYDALGPPYKISNPHNSTAQYWTTTQFDALGRPTKTLLPDGNQTTYAYSGVTTTLTDPAGKQRKSQSDALGRLAYAFEPDVTNNNSLTQQTSYGYNVLDQLLQVTQGIQTRAYVYDGLGRLTSATTPESGQVQYAYNSFDLVTQRTDARGVITTYSYDSLNRLTNVSYNVGSTGVPATSTIAFSYGTSSASNNNGRLVTMTDGAGSENYTYDILGRITKLDKTINGTTYSAQYAYNFASELFSTTYPSGRIAQPSYDAIGRVLALSATMNSVNTTYASGYGYNPAGEMTGFNYGNGVVSSYGFSADRLQLTSIGYTKGTQTLFSSNYWYKTDATNCPNAPSGNNGQIQCITDNVDIGRSTAYTYDALYRLSSAVTTGSAAYPKWGLSWTYDRYGNRNTQSILSGCVAPMNCPTNFVTPDSATNRISGDCYDANGNLLAESAPPCPSPTYSYDAENRLTAYGASAAYIYDGNGLRVKKCLPNCTSPTSSTVYIFSGSKVIAEYDNGATPGSPSREYIYSAGALLAKIESGATTYYHPEHLSNRLLTDANGNVTGQRGHFPFGETWYETGTTTKLKFTSYERDAESGNDFAMARYDVNRLGRFSAPDPLAGSIANPQSLNRYAHALNDPVNLTDPSGLFIAPQEMGLRNAGWLNYDPFGGGWNEFDLLNSSTVLEGVWINWHIKINPEWMAEETSAWFVIDSIEPVYGGLLMDPGDPSGGSKIPLNPRDQKRFVGNRDKLVQKILSSEDCRKFLTEHGIDPLALVEAIKNQQPYNGSKSTITLGDAGLVPASDQFAGETVKKYFQVSTGTLAFAQPNGTDVYYRQGSIISTPSVSPGDIAHEAVHNLKGLNDEQLQALFGLTVDVYNTANINQALKDHGCIP